MKNNKMLKIYVCGPTVYNHVHIGNLRPVLTFDLILKAARELNYDFKFIHNITDIDDKIIEKAIKENKNEKEISNFFTNKYLELLNILNINTITNLEKVTDNLPLIDNYINKLVISKNAYLDENQNVWFDVKKNIKAYGNVSNQKLSNMIFEDKYKAKKFEADFALWKQTNIGIQFNSSFGKGRPGWHTECVALIDKHFAEEELDFHGGGMDLTFPHHENENIQHWSLYNKNLCKNWLRTGQINLEGVKMSKSLGNVILAKDFLNKYGPAILKLLFFNSKITAPINITDELISNMQQIENKYKKFIFKFFVDKLDVNTDNDNLINNKKYNDILLSVYNQDFAKYNFLINELFKLINKENDIENKIVLFKIFNLFHSELTDKNKYLKHIEIFKKWQEFLEQKEYSKADNLRQILIDANLI
ncbi:class I tRNA ligase family protein [Mycoplasma sp. 1018B]|uniref:class I tRNA ligase family protein n=1 Tax=Mycoplasma sp. 1018B TaxID=2967302 RepID=UPI00211BCF06|nr:class I tRNA ligase family protein [Mycoplasma sp. 1018B]UUM19325.1 class I tRNA ligase family protein [Mycoplasma sp. 1018B]